MAKIRKDQTIINTWLHLATCLAIAVSVHCGTVAVGNLSNT